MGVVYHGHYAQLYEIGRNESLRSLGFNYKDIEASGIGLLVTDIHSKFLRPAYYDDLITIATTLKELPKDHKIIFHTEMYNETDKLLHIGVVTLYFMEVKTMTKSEMPSYLKERLNEFFI